MRGFYSLLETLSLLFLAKNDVMVSPNFLFCLMSAKDIPQNEVCDYFGDNSYFRGSSLHDDCERFITKAWMPEKIDDCALFIESDEVDIEEENKIMGKWNQFLDYMIQYDKEYDTMDDIRERYLIFHDNLDFIHAENDKDHSYKLGINQFADYSHEEFKNYVQRGLELGKTTCPLAKDATGTLPTSIDWRAKGIVATPMSQGQVGTCYTFSTTAAMEGALAQKTGKFTKLSEQAIVDCSSIKYGDMGVNGGSMEGSFNFVHDNGIPTEESYPYKAAQGTCQKYTPFTYNTGCYEVPKNELQITYAVSQRVISIAIQADSRSFQLYQSGVYDDPKCYTGSLDHGVALVGYGHDSSSNKDYYILKNSWGSEGNPDGNWGMNGYMMIGRNSVASSTTGICGLAMMASYPVL